jgi:acyl-CoA synthetase (AMP-forming)/AMP-acid ligase II
MLLLDLLSARAEQQFAQSAFVFLDEHGMQQDAASFGELARASKALAAYLGTHAAVGERVILCYPPGLDFVRAFFACLYAGLIAVPLYPPRPRQKLDRLRNVLSNCKASLILSHSGVRFDDPLHGRLIFTDTLPADAEPAELPAVTPEHLAFLQYTSGSTGDPKGVMVSHANIIANLQALHETTGCSGDDVFVNWLPAFHDLGLINTILLPVFLGAPSVLMAPIKFIQRPRLWLEAITRHRGTIAGAPNFAFDLCLERITSDELTGLDLRTWRIAFNAAEPIQARTLDEFATFFAPVGFRKTAFYPSYGMAEATVFLAGG